MQIGSKIYVAGHRGLLGSAIIRELLSQGYRNIVTRSHFELDLTKQNSVREFFKRERPDFVFLCAGIVGGIVSNNLYRAEFIYKNLMIQANIIHAAFKTDVKKLLAMGSSCIYPRNCPQPIKEEYLLTSELEYTNRPYAISKIAALEMVDSYRLQYGCNFISAMPTNLYGKNDTYKNPKAHVLPALIRRIHQAKIDRDPHVAIWGSGNVKREFLFSDDCAEACIFLMNNYNEPGPINIGTGEDITINLLAEIISSVVGFQGRFTHDLLKPDGTPRKMLDVSKINNLGWKSKTKLNDGIEKTYQYFLQEQKIEEEIL